MKENHDNKWFQQLFGDYTGEPASSSSSLSTTLDCACTDYNYGDLSKLNKKCVEKFYKIGSKSIKCNHRKRVSSAINNSCDNEISLEATSCREIDNENNSLIVTHSSTNLDNCLSIENNCQINDCLSLEKTTTTTESTEMSTTDANNCLMFSNSYNYYDVVSMFSILLTICYCCLFFDTFFYYILFLTTIASIICTMNYHVFIKLKFFLIHALNTIKFCYFNGSFYTVSLLAALFSLFLAIIFFKLFLLFFSFFYYIMPKSKYFYLKSLLYDIVSFDYPESIEFHDKYYYCFQNSNGNDDYEAC